MIKNFDLVSLKKVYKEVNIYTPQTCCYPVQGKKTKTKKKLKQGERLRRRICIFGLEK